MDTITIFGITVPVSRVAFSVFGWEIYWYGIIITVGVFLALFYGMKNAKRFDLNPDHIFDSFFIVLLVSILCARAYYIIFDPGVTFREFFDFSKHHGFTGLAIYGGVIGAAITIPIMCKLYRFSLVDALDITSIGFLIGQGIGRWGNFVNQEAYGTFTGSNWFGMTGSIIAAETGSDALVHPCFLYESIWCIAGFFLLHHFSKKRRFRGQIALMYGMWYGFERTFIELLRTDSLMLGSIRVSSLLSAILCVSCTVGLVILGNKQREKEEQYVPQFGSVEEMVLEKGNAPESAEADGADDAVIGKTTDEIATETADETAGEFAADQPEEDSLKAETGDPQMQEHIKEQDNADH